MINDYIHHMTRKRRSVNTIRLRLFYLRKLEDALGGDLASATHETLDAFIWQRNWSDNTRNTVSTTICTFYSWATREAFLSENPSRELPPIIVRRRRQRIASEDAIEEAIRCDDISDRAMVMLGAECGLRVTEIATLKVTDRDGEWLDVIGKGRRIRRLHLSPELETILDVIDATRARGGYYFPGRSGSRPVHSSTAWRHITAVLNSNPHSLRRRAGTIVYRNSGHDLRLAQEFLGHALSTTTELYLDIRDDDLLKAGDLTRIAPHSVPLAA